MNSEEITPISFWIEQLWGVGGSKIALKKGRYRVGQGRLVGQKWPKNEGRH